MEKESEILISFIGLTKVSKNLYPPMAPRFLAISLCLRYFADGTNNEWLEDVNDKVTQKSWPKASTSTCLGPHQVLIPCCDKGEEYSWLFNPFDKDLGLISTKSVLVSKKAEKFNGNGAFPEWIDAGAPHYRSCELQKKISSNHSFPRLVHWLEEFQRLSA